MKEYKVAYELKGRGYITVTAENEEDAMEEIERVFCGDLPKHDENSWIDNDILWDIEWNTTDVLNALEI